MSFIRPDCFNDNVLFPTIIDHTTTSTSLERFVEAQRETIRANAQFVAVHILMFHPRDICNS